MIDVKKIKEGHIYTIDEAAKLLGESKIGLHIKIKKGKLNKLTEKNETIKIAGYQLLEYLGIRKR